MGEGLIARCIFAFEQRFYLKGHFPVNNTGTNEPKKSTKMFVNGVLILTISNILVKTIGLLFKIPLHYYLGD